MAATLACCTKQLLSTWVSMSSLAAHGKVIALSALSQSPWSGSTICTDRRGDAVREAALRLPPSLLRKVTLSNVG